MAMIKCPECGHEVSDRAPICPNCGVEIAGKVIKCPQCGEVYFKDLGACPNCHRPTRLAGQVGNDADAPKVAPQPVTPRQEPRQPVPPTPPQPSSNASDGANGGVPPTRQASAKPKKNYTPLIIGFIIALILVAGGYYFYSASLSNKEMDAYESAMQSDNPTVLQTYLDMYKDAPQAHRDSISAHLLALRQIDIDWNNAVVSGSKQALNDYLAKYPDTEHKTEILSKIDSIDWAQAKSQNTVDAIQAYLANHYDGNYVDDANTLLKKLNAKTISPEDKTLVATSLRRFFQAINAKNAGQLEASVAPVLSNFIGKADASPEDVVTFMNKIYKDDITNMNWHVNNDYKIDKKEVSDDSYEYSVSFTASQAIERTDAPNKETFNYKISAKIDPDGKIMAMTMTRVLE